MVYALDYAFAQKALNASLTLPMDDEPYSIMIVSHKGRARRFRRARFSFEALWIITITVRLIALQAVCSLALSVAT